MRAVESLAPLPVITYGCRRASEANVRLLEHHGLLKFVRSGVWVKQATQKTPAFAAWAERTAGIIAGYRSVCTYFGVTDADAQDKRISELIPQRSLSQRYVDRCQKLKLLAETAGMAPLAKHAMDEAFKRSHDLRQAATVLLEHFSGREEELFSKLDPSLAAHLRNNHKMAVRAQQALARYDAMRDLYLLLGFDDKEWKALLIADCQSTLDDNLAFRAKRFTLLAKACGLEAKDKAALKAMFAVKRRFNPCFNFLARRAKETNRIENIFASLNGLPIH